MARRVVPSVGRAQVAPVQAPAPAQVLLPSALLVPLDQLAPDPGQPRRHFDEEALANLARSIAAEGILQPLLVYEDGALADGRARYVIVDGERRYRAALCVRHDVPVIVQEGRDLQEVRVRQLVANLQREDLDPLEEALALRQLMQLADLSLDGVAGRIGKPKAYVQRRTDLLYDPRLAEAVREGRMNASVAVELRRFSDAERQAYLERVAAGERLEVAQLREAKRQARAILFGEERAGARHDVGAAAGQSYRIDTTAGPATPPEDPQVTVESYRFDTAEAPAVAARPPQMGTESYRIDTAPPPGCPGGMTAGDASEALIAVPSGVQAPRDAWAEGLAQALMMMHNDRLSNALRTWRAAGEPAGWGDALIAHLADRL